MAGEYTKQCTGFGAVLPGARDRAKRQGDRSRAKRPRDRWRYGRGRRPIALRTALRLSVNPISAISAAAWTAVPTTATPVAVVGLRVRGGAGVLGVRGGAGVRGVWERVVAAGRAGTFARDAVFAGAAALARDAVLRVAAAFARGAAAALLRRGAGAARDAAGAVRVGLGFSAAGKAVRAGRFSLRRWGRVRGRAPRRSEEGSSVIVLLLGTSVQPETDLCVERKVFYKNAEHIPREAFLDLPEHVDFIKYSNILP
jgi:hypothetical protein